MKDQLNYFEKQMERRREHRLKVKVAGIIIALLVLGVIVLKFFDR